MAARNVRAEVEAMRRAHIALLRAAEDEFAVRLATVFIEIDKTLLGMLDAAPGALTEARVADLLAAMRHATADELEALVAAMPEYVEDVLIGSLRDPFAYARLLSGSASRTLPEYRAIAATLRAVHGSETLLAIMAPALDEATAAVAARYAEALEVIGKKLAAGSAKGMHASDLAKEISTEAGQINVAELGTGRIDDEAFARMIARTTVSQADNDVARAEGEALGLDLWVNIGVPDERQAPECEAASNMGAMTRDEWEASDVGAAPRHENCRCELLAVSEDAAENAGWLQGRARRPEGQQAARREYEALMK